VSVNGSILSSRKLSILNLMRTRIQLFTLMRIRIVVAKNNADPDPHTWLRVRI
jgi:hypothetical protein